MANVLSTTQMPPWWWAASATAAMSTTSRSGLVGVSAHTRRVLGVQARATASGSVRSTALQVTPVGASTRLISRKVPP